ncbi:BLUF domain-containing protein [Ottowia beijingensis]|uniref:BLUF domain-containing protein n=1 Tax=Ottowia beijingensis TaxID=1207057 RepID=UPI002FD8B809
MQHLSWCYVSTATPAFDPARLDDLYAQGRAFNAPRRVSGVLLFCNGRFCQLLEGPAASMEEVIGRVQRSSLHTDVLTLHREPITLPVFPSWSLGTASDWRGQRMPHDLDSGRFGFLTPTQRAACRVLTRFIDWEEAGAAQDFTPTRY